MITSAIPKLPFIDSQKTRDYYTRLGFTLQSGYGDYLIMSLDGVELHFFSFPALVPTQSDFMVYLRVDQGIQDLYKSLQDKGIAIHPNGKLEDKPWRQREFALIDPNGTLLTFGEKME